MINLTLTRFLLVALTLQLLPVIAHAQTKVWDRRFGGTIVDEANAVAASPDGGMVIAGGSTSAANGDKSQGSQGGLDFWLVKVDANGNKVWDRRFGGTDDDMAYGIVAAHGGGYVAVGYSSSGVGGDKVQSSRGGSDYWIVKIDENGNKVWDRRFGGSSTDYATSVTRAPGGGYVVAGVSFSGAGGDKTQGSRGSSDYWIIKIDENGTKIWDRRFGGTVDDAAEAVVASPQGGYIIAGSSFSGASGDKTQGSVGGFDYWLLKVDENGNKVWDRRFGGHTDDRAYGLAIGSGGSYVVAGSSSSGVSGDKSAAPRGGGDFWLVKFDEAGNKVWDRVYGGTSIDSARALVPAPMGGFLVAGFSSSGANGDKSQSLVGERDYWLVRLDDCGNLLWERRFGGFSSDTTTGVAIAPNGDFMVVGYSLSGAGGDKTESGRGFSDYWAVRVREPQPTVQRFDALQPILGLATNRWSFMTAWNLCTGEFQVSPKWQNGGSTWNHNAGQYWHWIARFTYDDVTGKTTSLAWYYRQLHVQ